jgi:hypothetical protein
MPTARALNHADQADDPHESKAPASGASHMKRAPARATTSKGSRQASPQQAAAQQQRAPSRELKLGQVALGQAKKHASPLLIGAGIGATVALSLVALRSREKPATVALFASPNSTFFSAIVKTAAFAIGRSAAKGSLVGLVARVVGKALE